MEENRKPICSGLMIFQYAIVFISACLVMTVLLVATSLIPQVAIQTNMKESAAFIRTKQHLENVIPSVRGTQLHYSADATWFSIAYGFDPEHPFESTMWANYYSGKGGLCQSFADQVQNHIPGNMQYCRYWHGSAGILRFLHLVFNARQIYILQIVLMILLFISLTWLLCRHGFIAEAIAFGIALLMVSSWVVPLCLEYIFVFLIMLSASIFAVRMALWDSYKNVGFLFLLTGMATVYLDFLTSETLTLLIPLLFILRIYSLRQEDSRKMWSMAIKASALWLIGYCDMWAMKWVIASAVLHQNVMPMVTAHIEERLGGSVGLALPEYLTQTLVKNIKRLAFYDYGVYGAAAVFVLLFMLLLPVFTGRVSLREKISWGRIGLYAVLMTLPYVRYLVLHNHSYGHFFFTYRAQAASILALCFIILELVRLNPRKAVMKNVRPYHPDALPE